MALLRILVLVPVLYKYYHSYNDYYRYLDEEEKEDLRLPSYVRDLRVLYARAHFFAPRSSQHLTPPAHNPDESCYQPPDKIQNTARNDVACFLAKITHEYSRKLRLCTKQPRRVHTCRLFVEARLKLTQKQKQEFSNSDRSILS